MATENQQSNPDSTERYGAKGGITITQNAAIRFVFTNKYVQHTINIVTVAIFFYAIYRAAVGPTDLSVNFGSVAFFGLWWTPIMLLSLVFFGRIWCYFCPMGAIVRFTQRFGFQRHFPMYTRKWVVFGLAYAPLGIMFTLGAHAIGGLLEEGRHTLNVFAHGIGIPLDLPTGASPAIVSVWNHFFVTGWLWLAVLWSALIAWQVATTMTHTKKRALKAFAPHFALMAGSTYIVAIVLATHG